ncbi:MAG: ABC transporter ATP-binding protein [Lachnospiraceae bacterium]
MYDSIIEAKDIQKSYGTEMNRVEALKKVSLAVGQGEFVALTGYSGSGKSTLLHVLGGLLKPDGGSVFVYDKNISEMTEKELTEFRGKTMGFVFQTFYLERSYTALENVALPLLAQKVQKSERVRLATEALNMVGLSDRKEHIPSQLSGGEMQRVCIARALVCNPVLILADEPTGNLDRKNAEVVYQILRGLADSGKTVIMVTHDENAANRCDRVIRLEDGRIIDEYRGKGIK